MAEQRRALHAYLSDEAHETWHRIADEAGVTLSGLVEALAVDFATVPPDGTGDGHGHPRWADVVRAARRIDAQRRRRRPH